MNKMLLPLLLAVLAGGCSNEAGNAPAANAANPAAANPAAANAVNPAAANAAANTAQLYNGMSNVDPAAFNANGQNLKVIPYVPKKDELPYGSRVGPDDSVISSASRGKEFVETRTFKNHPGLLKVEKIMDGTNTKYKVYLKNGRVLDGPADKLDNMAALAPQTILEAVGQAPKAPAAAATPAAKKEGQP